MSPLALDSKTFPKVVTVLDTSIATSSVPFAVHALASDSTIFLSGAEIASYLKGLETAEVKIHEIDFEALKSESAAPAISGPSRPAQQDKASRDEAKIEGSVKIAIGVRKEVDFSAWYTNVHDESTLDIIVLILFL